MHSKNLNKKIFASLICALFVFSFVLCPFVGHALVAEKTSLSNPAPIYNDSQGTPNNPAPVETPPPSAPLIAPSLANPDTPDSAEPTSENSDINSNIIEEEYSTEQDNDQQTNPVQNPNATTAEPIISPDPAAPSVYSKYAALIDADTGNLLYEKSGHIRIGPASTTKILTAIIVLENVDDLSEMATVSGSINQLGGDSSKMHVVEGEILSVKDLLYGLLMVSGNDAAIVLAEHVSGSIEAFAIKMNAKVQELGLLDTHFVNPHGLTNEQHYSTAADMAQIMRYAMTNPDFAAIDSKAHYDRVPTNKNPNPLRMPNSNRFLTSKDAMKSFNWSACTGGKTGYTHDAQGCLVISASFNGMNLIAATMHDDSLKQVERWTDTRKLTEYGFNNLVKIDLGTINFSDIKVDVENYSKKDDLLGALDVEIKADGVMISGIKYDLDPIRNGSVNLNIAPNINQGVGLTAPIVQGQKVGTAMVLLGEENLAEVDLIAKRSIESSQSDPVNPVSTLFTSATSKNNGFTSFLAKAFIALGVIVVILLVILLVRRMLLSSKKQTRRRRKTPKNQITRYRNK